MNFSLSSALKCACALSAAILTGCGSDEGGVRDFDSAKEAYEAHDLKKAERLFDKAAKAATTNVEAFVYLSRVRLELGELPAARESVAKAAELAGGDADVRLLDAQISWHAKDYARATKLFKGVAEDPALTPELCAQGWSGLGVVEMAGDHYDAARIAFLRAIRLDRRNASARYHLGLLYRDGFGYPEAALEQLEIYVRLDAVASPRVQKVQRTMIPELKETIARSAAGRPGAARRDSAASAAAIQKADAAWKKGAYKSARSLYQTALKADPLSYPAAMGVAKATLKADASRSGQLQALSNYRIACLLRPSAVSTFILAGDLAQRLAQPATAVEIYSRAVAANPTSLEAIDGLIRSLRRLGNRSKTAQAYQEYRDFLAKTKK